jgi:contractile injection system tube protein
MAMLDGKLLKMLILAYSTDSNGIISGIPIPYPVMYNPESFTKSSSVEYKRIAVPGSSGTEYRFDKVVSDQVSFDFLFDATGASVNSINGEIAKTVGGVDLEIETFLELTRNRNAQTHENYTLTLVWGTFILTCKLESASVNYTLFAPNGRPLRAKVNARFKGHQLRILQLAFDKLFSADLTHVRIVKTGETLPWIAKEVYGDPKYYLELARINGLKNFRNLKPGMELILPPLNKIEN